MRQSRPHRLIMGGVFKPKRPWGRWVGSLLVHLVRCGLLSSCSDCLVQLIMKVPAGRAMYPGVQSGRPGRLGLINQSIE